jgi:hypothetical protein
VVIKKPTPVKHKIEMLIQWTMKSQWSELGFYFSKVFCLSVMWFYISLALCFVYRDWLFLLFSPIDIYLWHLKDITVCLDYCLYTEDQVGTENLQSLILNLHSLISRSRDMFCIDNDYLSE